MFNILLYNIIHISFWHYLLNIINFLNYFKKVYTVIITVSLELQELNIRLTNIEKENNQRKPEASDKDVLNMQQLFPFQDINKVTAFENQLSQNVDEYNKFVSLILLRILMQVLLK